MENSEILKGDLIFGIVVVPFVGAVLTYVFFEVLQLLNVI